MIKRYINHILSILPYCYLSLHTSILAMAKFMCMLVFLTRVYVATSIGLYHDFVMITGFSNKVLKNSWKEISHSSSRSLLDCSTQCGRCCNCFGFNTLTKVCRVFKRCDRTDFTEHEEGWTYHSLKDLHEKGESHYFYSKLYIYILSKVEYFTRDEIYYNQHPYFVLICLTF